MALGFKRALVTGGAGFIGSAVIRHLVSNTDVEVIDQDWYYKDLRYVDTRSSYFDLKIQNPRTSHGAPDYAIQQAINFVIENSGRSKSNNHSWLIPIIDLILQ